MIVTTHDLPNGIPHLAHDGERLMYLPVFDQEDLRTLTSFEHCGNGWLCAECVTDWMKVQLARNDDWHYGAMGLPESAADDVNYFEHGPIRCRECGTVLADLTPEERAQYFG